MISIYFVGEHIMLPLNSVRKWRADAICPYEYNFNLHCMGRVARPVRICTKSAGGETLPIRTKLQSCYIQRRRPSLLHSYLLLITSRGSPRQTRICLTETTKNMLTKKSGGGTMLLRHKYKNNPSRSDFVF